MSIKAKVTEFSIDLDYEITKYEPLKALAKDFEYISAMKKTRWTFHIQHLPEVIGLLGKPVQFDVSDHGIGLLLEHCPNLAEEIQMKRYKGKGEITVRRMIHQPKGYDHPIQVFKVTWQQQKKPRSRYVPVESVEEMWEVIERYDIGALIPTHLNVEHYCKHMGITRFNRKTESGRFDFAKAFGERVFYFEWYSIIKVLQHYRLVEHKKKGGIVRKADKLVLGMRYDHEGMASVNHALDDFREGAHD